MKLITNIVCTILTTLIILIAIRDYKQDELNKDYARAFWREAYVSGQLNQALKRHDGHDFDYQYKIDSLSMERRVEEWFK